MDDTAKECIRSYADWVGLPDGTPEEILEKLLDMLSSDKLTAQWIARDISAIGAVTDAVIPALIKNLNL